MTLTYVYRIFGLETTTTCPGCGLETKKVNNFVIVPRFTTRVIVAPIVCDDSVFCPYFVMQY